MECINFNPDRPNHVSRCGCSTPESITLIRRFFGGHKMDGLQENCVNDLNSTRSMDNSRWLKLRNSFEFVLGLSTVGPQNWTICLDMNQAYLYCGWLSMEAIAILNHRSIKKGKEISIGAIEGRRRLLSSDHLDWAMYQCLSEWFGGWEWREEGISLAILTGSTLCMFRTLVQPQVVRHIYFNSKLGKLVENVID